MIIKKVLNNNVVLSEKNNQEMVVMGKGIAFGKKAGDILEENKIDKTFYLQNFDTSERFKELLKDVPMKVVSLSYDIIEYAKKVCGEAKVQGVIGGWHLFKVDDRLEKTIAYLQKHNIRELYPCHCCSFQAKAAVHAQIPVKEIGVGKVIEIN